MAGTDRGLDAETDLALERALEAANLRAGDALASASVVAADPAEPSAAETGEFAPGFDGD